MNNNQKLTGIVLFVVTIVFMFGLHITFLLIETAEATHASNSCRNKSHRIYATIEVSYTERTPGGRDKETNCVACAGESPKTHYQRRWKNVKRTRWLYEHKYWWQSSWSDCHEHGKETWTFYYVTVACE